MHILVYSQDSKVSTLPLVFRLYHEDGIRKRKNIYSTPKKNELMTKVSFIRTL